MFTTKTAGMASYSKQINRQRIFFPINVKLTNTLLLPANKTDVRNTAWQNIMAFSGRRIISSLVTHYHDAGNRSLRVSPWLFYVVVAS